MKTRPAFLRSRVARRVLVQFLLAAFLPVAATTFLVVKQTQETLTTHGYEQLRFTSKAIGQAIYERLLFVERSTKEMAARFREHTTTIEQAQQLVNEYFRNMIIVADPGNLGLVPSGENQSRRSISAVEHLADGGSLLAWAKTNGEQATLKISRSFDPARAELGLIVADVNLDYLWGDPESLPYIMEYCVMREAAAIIYCSNSWARTIAGQVPPQEMDGSPGQFDAQYDGEDFLVSYWPVFLTAQYHSQSWTVLAIRAESDIMAPIVAFNAIFAPVILLTVLLVAFLSISQIRKILVPLDKLISGTRRISKRRFGSEIQINSGDEFEELADSMNTMSQNLETQFDTLQILSEIDTLILARADIESVIETVLNRIREVSHYVVASLTLIDHDSASAARMFVSHDGNNLDIERIMLSEPQRELFCTGSARVIDAKSSDDVFLLPLVNLGARSIFVLPLMSRGRFSAIISLGYRDTFIAPINFVTQISEFGDRIIVALSATAHEEQLYIKGHYDPLTSLPNRQLFRDRLRQSIAHAHRQDLKGALLYVDFDHFKVVNDSQGHTVGDELLIQAANRLSSYVSDADTVARLGGDEFAVILSNIDSLRTVGGVADDLLELLADPFKLNDRDQFISASIGIAIYPDDGTTSEELLRNADTAMYRAKANGRGTHTFFTNEMNIQAVNRHRLELDLHNALGKNQFYLEYQPQVDLDTHRIIGAEALIRWRHGDRGLISPAQFVPLAESTGHIISIGKWALQTACEQFMAWQSQGVAPDRIAVNVSPLQITQSDFASTVRTVLRDMEMSPMCLELEITENLLLDKTDDTLHTLKALHMMGIRIAIDDFGTGYSSMSYLNRLSFDILKLDRSFVMDLGASEEANAIVHAIIALAQSLRKEVVAEGIETREQARILNRTYCQYGQGYFFSEPLSASKFALLAEHQDKKIAS